MAKTVEVRVKDGVEEITISKTKAIRLRCLDCCGFEVGQVRECDNLECPLYEMRLTGKLSGEKAGSLRNKAIRDYCYHCMGKNRQLINNCSDSNCSLWAFK